MIGRRDLAAALPGWVAGRVLTAVAWLASSALVSLRDIPRPAPMQEGLFAWDGIYYRVIAESGYLVAGPGASRFHPLLPVLGTNALGLVLLTQVLGLLAAALTHRVVDETFADDDLARRAATLVGIAPPAFSLVWVYGEGLQIAIAALHLLALRGRRWVWVTVLGALAVLARPTGLLLVVPVLVVAWQDRGERRWSGPAAATLVPAATMAAWITWVGDLFGDRTLPLDVQTSLRDGTHVPPFRLLEAVGELLTDPLGDGLHLPFAILLMALCWVAWRRQPPAWAWYAIASTTMFLAAGNLNSMERYGYATVPLLVALAQVSDGRRWRPIVVLSGLGLLGMATLGWQGELVP